MRPCQLPSHNCRETIDSARAHNSSFDTRPAAETGHRPRSNPGLFFVLCRAGLRMYLCPMTIRLGDIASIRTGKQLPTEGRERGKSVSG